LVHEDYAKCSLAEHVACNIYTNLSPKPKIKIISSKYTSLPSSQPFEKFALLKTGHNFARVHKSLSNPYPRTPAMAAGIENHIWTIGDIVKLIDSN
jgi:hypothetical protein